MAPAPAGRNTLNYLLFLPETQVYHTHVLSSPILQQLMVAQRTTNSSGYNTHRTSPVSAGRHIVAFKALWWSWQLHSLPEAPSSLNALPNSFVEPPSLGQGTEAEWSVILLKRAAKESTDHAVTLVSQLVAWTQEVHVQRGPGELCTLLATRMCSPAHSVCLAKSSLCPGRS